MSLIKYIYDPLFDNSLPAEFNPRLLNPFDALANCSPHREVAHINAKSCILKPSMDLHESKDKSEMTATLELPGMKKEDVSMEVHRNLLIISGQSSLPENFEKDGYIVRERKYGKFNRTLPLPVGIKLEDIKANMDNGVLTVKFLKTSHEEMPKKIVIA